MVGTTDGALEFCEILLGLFLGESVLSNPIVVDFGLADTSDDAVDGFLGGGETAILVEIAVVKQQGKAKDEGVEVERRQVPVIGLGYADAVVDRREGRMVRAKADALRQPHLEGNIGEDKATGLELFGQAGEAMCESSDGFARVMLKGAPISEILPQPAST